MWKEQFAQTVMQYIQQSYGISISNESDIIVTINNINNRQKRSLWVDISKILKCKTQQIHDYYHNTWIKQYYSNFTNYKPELRNILSDAQLKYKDLPREKQIALTVDQFIQKYPYKNFHVRGVQQFLFQFYKTTMKQSQDTIQISDTTNKIMSRKQQDDEEYLMQQLKNLLKQLI